MIRRTKILATIGPASRDPAVLDELLQAGLDAVRLNFSHGTHDSHIETIQRVREAAARQQRTVAILQDLQGPKIRLGQIDGEVPVLTGSGLVITTRNIIGMDGLVPTDHVHLPQDVSPGMSILLDEGRVRVIVRAVVGTEVECEVAEGGLLSSNKGMNVPGAALTAAAMTEKDRIDVRLGLDLGVDFVALSFVRRATDVKELRQFMISLGRVVPIIAKIEKPQAVEAIEEIVQVADGVMVARGDLAIEATLEMIPAYQKQIIKHANEAGKLVITATQMLESMIENPLPTRAEVTDVANAILDGTDVLMLSGETAIGKHPVETVRRMGAIARVTEESLFPFERDSHRSRRSPPDLSRITARITAQAAREAGAHAIVVLTESGDAATVVSGERPRAPIIAFTRETATVRRLQLYWGVQALLMPETALVADLMQYAEQRLVEERWIAPGHIIVFVLGTNLARGADHSVRLRTVA